jgi:hypothetical protein
MVMEWRAAQPTATSTSLTNRDADCLNTVVSISYRLLLVDANIPLKDCVSRAQSLGKKIKSKLYFSHTRPRIKIIKPIKYIAKFTSTPGFLLNKDVPCYCLTWVNICSLKYPSLSFLPLGITQISHSVC